ncbi:MAG: FixH family protein [Syntrophothermus sp.]
MKFHWGARIALIYGLFVLIVLVMVGYFMSGDVELVTGRYYDDGIMYQERINTIERTKALPKQISFTVKDSSMVVQFPENFDPRSISGSLLLYRPSDDKQDKKFEIKADNKNQFIVGTLNIERGLWKIKADWKSGGVAYYNEETVQIQ